MAEDGIEDYALAKRKAARQAGSPTRAQLPDQRRDRRRAARRYQQLYQRDDTGDRLRALRERRAAR